MKRLTRVLRLKTDEAERLGVLCNEFDEIENDYKQQVSTFIKERNQLKGQLNSLFANADRYQRAELREKDFDTSLIRSVGNLNVGFLTLLLVLNYFSLTALMFNYVSYLDLFKRKTFFLLYHKYKSPHIHSE
ncbi:hypothetical protein DICVIV_13568 [Dictyocaulus viviparus]|uniref:Uncharacterized protein n=1 Tax=Dictyocaulus viviparus TaxID=29172 RepID=A0A0D8X7G3_DICVI|nr:hypothetical protein DICVIV_13568 [Dictyocaulus viviparus]